MTKHHLMACALIIIIMALKYSEVVFVNENLEYVYVVFKVLLVLVGTTIEINVFMINISVLKTSGLHFENVW